jgi:fibronectin type 3 domain-containing protein
MKLSRILIFALLTLVAGGLFSCKKKVVDPPDPVDPPNAPILLAVLDYGQTYANMNWSDQSTDEDGFRVEKKQAGGEWQTAGLVGANEVNYNAAGLTPGTEYSFRVFAYNEGGDSGPTNVQTITTHENNQPSAPTLVQGNATSTTSILLTWQKQGEPDSFRVERKTSSSDFSEVIRVAADIEEFENTGLTPNTTYIYRVGAKNEAGTAWSSESDPVTTPFEGAPNAPSNVEAEGVIGFGITLNWTDNSSDEDGFIIRRNTSGHSFQTIDSVDANVTTYYDDLGDAQETYTYRVRSFNEHGESGDAQSNTVEFSFNSPGIIPLRPGNEWRYNVIENGQEPFELRRVVASQVGYVMNVDHYLIVEHPFPTGEAEIDSTIYLRNFEGVGCKGVPYPLTGNSVSELLFRYPTGNLGSHYFYRGDSISVISTGTTKTVNEVTYDGVVGYQRFLHGQSRSIRYWLKPEEIGIILEEEVVSSAIVLKREYLGNNFGD